MRNRSWRAIGCFCLLSLWSVAVNAQDSLLYQKMTFNYSSLTVAQFLDSIAGRLNVGVSYDSNALPADSVMTVSATNEQLRDILYRVFARQAVEVSSLPSQVVISRQTFVAKVVKNEVIRITGRISDLEDNASLAAANICVVGQPMGTITNENGAFEFIVPRSFEGQTLAFSMMGYLSEFLKVPANDSVINLMMTSSNIKLPEVEVKAVSAEEVIRKVVENRQRNYLLSSVALTGFFRETIRQDGGYVQVSEAVVEIFKPPYDEPFSLERVRFIKGRRSNAVEDMNFVQFRLQGGPFYFSRVDVARYMDFLPENSQSSIYKYSYRGGDELWGRRVMKIGFEPYHDSGDLLYEGEIVVDAESFAVAAVSFQMTRNALKQSRKYLIRKESRTLKSKPYVAKYHIDYRPLNDRWLLNSVRGEIRVKVVDKKEHVDSDFCAVTEMLISDMRPVDGKLPRYNETFKPEYILFDKISGFDSQFWENYNVIAPDQELKDVFKASDASK